MARKRDQAEIEQQVTEIYSLVISCYSRSHILQYASKKWGINSRSTDTLIQRARKRMMEITAIQREEAYAEEMELRREIIRKAMEDKKYGLALQAADSRAKLRGLFDKLEQAIDTVTAHGYEVSDPTEITETQGEIKEAE